MARSIVIGAGMVGLGTAWHLQEPGVDVTVIDRTSVAADSSWGNAGYPSPGMTIPLADPSVWTCSDLRPARRILPLSRRCSLQPLEPQVLPPSRPAAASSAEYRGPRPLRIPRRDSFAVGG